MTDKFNLQDSVRSIEAIIDDIQKHVPKFPMVFGYLPPGAIDPCYMMSDAENQNTAILVKLKAVQMGNFLDRNEQDDEKKDEPSRIAVVPEGAMPKPH